MTAPPKMIRSLCVAVDARGYGAATDQAQLSIQHHLVELLDAAAAATGLSRPGWSKQPAGDGELAVLSPDESEILVVDPFVRELDAALYRHNQDRFGHNRIKLRMAVHFGRVVPARNGYAGPAPVEVSRLLNSEQLRQALTRSGSRDLAVLLSNQVYADTVAPLHTTWRPNEFQRVRIREKEFEADAWLWTPHDTTPETLPESPCESASAAPSKPASKPPRPQAHLSQLEPASESPRPQTVHTTVGSVTGDNVVFGIQNT